MKQWELDEIMNRVEAVGHYKWETELESEVDDSMVNIIAVPLSGYARYSVAQEVAYEDAEFIVNALQDIPRLVARIKELEVVLTYYADEKNHTEMRGTHAFGDIYYEKGKLARSVLGHDD